MGTIHGRGGGGRLSMGGRGVMHGEYYKTFERNVTEISRGPKKFTQNI